MQSYAEVSKRRKIATHQESHDFSAVRRNMELYGEGIVKKPWSHERHPMLQAAATVPELPPKGQTDRLLEDYCMCFQLCLPVFHWSSFSQQCEEVYQRGSLHHASRDWIGVFFAVLACASLRGDQEQGKRFSETAKATVDFWTDNPTIDSVRCVYLTSIFQNETNARSAGWMALGHAIRMAQDIGLLKDYTGSSQFEEDMRRRMWWTLVVSDRYLIRLPGLVYIFY
jgi:hypothetical protein